MPNTCPDVNDLFPCHFRSPGDEEYLAFTAYIFYEKDFIAILRVGLMGRVRHFTYFKMTVDH